MVVAGMLLAAAVCAQPKIDGTIGAEEWSAAAVYDGMCLKGKAETFPVATTTWVMRDAANLYVAVRSAEPAPGLLARVMPKRFGALAYLDDTVTLAFGDGRTLAVNANGARAGRKEKGERRKEGESASWEPDGFLCASTVTNGFWTFECSLPLAEAGDLKGFDVGRHWPLADKAFGTDASLAVKGGCVPAEDLPRLQVLSVTGGATAYTVKLRTVNPGTKSVTFDVAASGRPVNSQTAVLKRKVTLAPGAAEELEMKGAILDDEPVRLAVGLKLADGTKSVRETVVRPNYAGSPFVRTGNDADLVAYKFAYYPSFNRFRAKVDVSLVPDFPRTVKGIRCAATDAAGKEVFARTIRPNEKGVADETFEVPDLRPLTVKSGNPEYRAKFTVEGLENVSYEKRFYRYAFDWEGNKVGLSDVVVPPFTAMSVKGAVVKTVLREHEMNSIGLFRQVKGPAREGATEPTVPILAGEGMRLIATVDGKEYAVGGRLVFADSNSPVRRDFTVTFDDHGFAGRVDGTFEYDGQLLWKLTMERGRIDALRLEIPYDAKQGTHMHACVDGLRQNFGGRVPAGTGSVWNGSLANGRYSLLGDYLPYIWIGGPLRGLSVYGDNDKGWVHFDGWPLKDSKKAPVHCQDVIREADGTVKLVLNLVQRPFEIAEPRTITLAFMATPVKPMLANWRGMDHGAFFGAGYMWGAAPQDADVEPFDGTDWFWRVMSKARDEGRYDKKDLDAAVAKVRYPGKPGEKQYEAVKGCALVHMRAGLEMCARERRKRPFVWYTNARGVDYGIPSGATFCDEWNVHEFMDMDRDFTCMSKRDYALDPNATFQDYAAWWYRKMCQSGACDSLYWDDIYLSFNFDLVGTESFRIPDGRIQPETGVFKMRALVKRCATMQTEEGFNATNNWIHMTDTAIAPISAFAGVHYDMEDCPRDGQAFQQKYPMDYLEAVSIGRQMGARVGIMAHYPHVSKEMDDWYERTGAGIMLCYEFRWKYNSYVFNRVHDKLKAWGYRTPAVRVWNYWNGDEPYPLKVKREKTASIAMAKRGSGLPAASGEAVFVVSDFTGKGGEVRVGLDAAALGLGKGFKAYDFEAKDPTEVRLEGNEVVLELKPYGFRAVMLKGGK